MIFNIIKSYVYTVKYNKQRGVPGASSGCGRRLRLLLKKTLTIQSVTVSYSHLIRILMKSLLLVP